MWCAAREEDKADEMGAFSHRTENLETLWSSILPKNGNLSFANPSDDGEIMKLSLLLKSTYVLFSGLRHKQLSALSQQESLSKQLTAETEKKRQCELETKALQEDVSQLKIQLQTATDKAKGFQKEAEIVTAKCERLKTRITAEVESRLLGMFKNCLQQNKAATLLDMMTQMYPETQMLDSNADEATAKHVASKMSSIEPTKQSNVDLSSPEVIQPTPPPQGKGSRSNIWTSKPSLMTHPKLPSVVENSIPSSPDVIAGTPTPPKTFNKPNNKTRQQKLFNLHNILQEDDSNEAKEKSCIIYARDTQDVEENQQTLARPLLTENIVVPGTYDPSDFDKEVHSTHRPTSAYNENGREPSKVKDVFSSRENEKHSSEIIDILSVRGQEIKKLPPEIRNGSFKIGKENERLSSSLKDNQEKKNGNLINENKTNLTPKKPLKLRENSPILGNSTSKKNNTRSVNTSTHAEKSKRKQGFQGSGQKKNTSFQSLESSDDEDAQISIHETAEGKMKTLIQPSIKQAFSQKVIKRPSLLSLSRRGKRKDISKEPCFNGGLRSAKGESLDMPELSEMEQFDSAISDSNVENSSNSILEDSDATMFIPSGHALSKKCQDISKNYVTPAIHHNLSKQNVGSQDCSLQSVFEPIFASTAKDQYCSTQQKDRPDSVTGIIGKPLFASTEKDLLVNSDLNMLADHLDLGDSDDSAQLDSSYDRLPKRSSSPGYAYKGDPVRKKAERKALPAMECTQCGKYFAMAFDDVSPSAKKRALDSCSRHRGKYPRVQTPPGYWDINVPSTQIMRERQEMPTQ